MYDNMTFTTAGELSGQYGIVTDSSGSNSISLASYDKLDEIKITATQLKVQYILDVIDPADILFDTFPPEKDGMISELAYGRSGVYALCNASKATARRRVDNNNLRFEDASDGYVAVLNSMMKLGFYRTPPSETILGHIHRLSANFLYTVIIRSFDKYYNLVDLDESGLAGIRYACACISANKLFKLSVDTDMVAIPLTTMYYSRVNPKLYAGYEMKTYADVVSYFNEKGIMIGLDKTTFIEAFIRQLGYRALVILECGVDFIIDVLMCRAISNLVPRNLFKLLGDSQYDQLQRNIAHMYITQVTNTDGIGDVAQLYK